MSTYDIGDWHNPVSYFRGTTSGTLPHMYTVYIYIEQGGSFELVGDSPWDTVHSCDVPGVELQDYGSQGLQQAVGYANGDGTITTTHETVYVITRTEDFYTLSFDANGGTGAPSDISYYGYGGHFTIPSQVPTRTGYKFLGWGYQHLQPGASYLTSSSETLRAEWKQLNKFQVNYDANQGSNAPSPTIEYSEATSQNVRITSSTPNRTDYDFLGWSTSSSGGVEYSPGGSISVNSGQVITLYAVWKLTEYSHTLYYNANGGSGAPGTQSVTNTTKNHSFTISGTRPTRNNYVFLGWSESSTATDPSYQPNGSITVGPNSSRTLYAVWRPDMWVKVNGSWKEVWDVQYRINGSWKKVTEINFRIGNRWQ